MSWKRARRRTRTYASDEMVDDGSLEDVAERDPVEEAKHGLERRLDQTRLVGLLENLDAKVEDLGELLALRRKRPSAIAHKGRRGGRTI